MNLSQMLAIARYEILLGFRRRSLIILLVMYVAGILIFALVAQDSSSSARRANPNMPIPASIGSEMWQGTSMVSISMMGTLVLMCVAITFLMNESIPLDRHFRVRELLDALPLSRATYLGGKMLGAWASILLVTAIAAVASLVVFLVFFRTFDLLFFVLMWVVFALPVVLIASALAVLLTSWAGSRRIALLNSLLIIPLVLVVFSAALPSLGVVGVFIDPSYGMFTLLRLDTDPVAIVNQRIRDVLPLLIGTPIFAWIAAYGWQRLREAR